MRINRLEQLHGNLLPSLCSKLSVIPADCLFHQQHEIRHPDSLYSISLAKFIYSINDVLDELDRVRSLRNSSTLNPIETYGVLRKYEVFLKAAQEHFESHFQILKALINPSTANCQFKFAKKYVKENSLPGASTFAAAVSTYENLLNCVNRLKHNHAILRYIGTSGPPSVDGFFFEEVGPNGVLGPSAKIHPNGKAFSFFRELPRHVFYVYMCSENLIDAINIVLVSKQRRPFDNFSATRASLYLEPEWKKVVSRISQLPIVCFPHETSQKMPRFNLSSDESSLSISLQDSVAIQWPAQMQVSFEHRIDPHHLSVQRPEI